ncbi:hypothetical protein R3W88_003535 [Solanum pinnatisectum]|uniref:Aldehyde dehydrogenase domain-containing protein n=1 Tax=Solanum pinnatisectum TaxID=50273 RepID=A0AAV9MPA1_9SOLN|nr:hypothetical protein R3W88_003535 [Solanum pinnatisectum]
MFCSSFFEQFLLSSSLIPKDIGASTACVCSSGSTDVSWMILWDIVNAICDDDDIEVASFVGSDAAQLYMRGRPFANNSKGAMANMGTKNYAVVMPYTNVEATLNALVAAGFGVAGQRCTTISTGLCWRLKITPGADLGPVISKQVHTLTLISTPIGYLQLVLEYLDITNKTDCNRKSNRVIFPVSTYSCLCFFLIDQTSLHKCCCTQVKTAPQRWKQFPGSEGGSPTLTPYYPQSNDGLSQGLQALRLQSRDITNGDGVHLPLHPNDFPVCDGESLGEHSRDDISQTVPIFDGSHWTLNF